MIFYVKKNTIISCCHGNLTAVKNGETLLWQWKELDKTGALTKDAICGSVVRTRIYDESGKVWSETAYKGNTGLMSLAYDYIFEN